MIRRFLLLWIVLIGTAQAQFSPPAMLSALTGTAPALCGPGDVAAFSAWYGLSAYSCAQAASLANAISARRASDSTLQDVPLLSNGNLNIASANTFAGPDGGTGACTASTSGSSTTLTIASCASSATLHAGDTLACSSCVQPVYILSLGTFSGTGAGASGTVTLNLAQNITSQTVTSQIALFIKGWYDQSGHSVTQTQATAGFQAQLLPNCGAFSNNQPCSVWIAANTQSYAGTLGGTIAQPWSSSAVAARTGNLAAFTAYLGGSTSNFLGWPNSTDTAEVASSGGSNVTAAASDNATHSIQGVLTGTNSFIVVDGTASGTQSGGVTAFQTAINLGILTGGSNMTGYVMTAGVAAGALSPTQYGQIHTLDVARWGTP